MTKDYTYTTQAGNAIRMTLYGAESFGDQPCILYLHGFKGFKDWGFVPFVGEYFAKNGLSFLAINFSHNGIGRNPLEFTDLDKFEKNTFSLETSEALEIINLVSHTHFFGKDINDKLGVLGHSRGGGIALLASSENDNVAAVATWAAVSTFDRYSKKVKQAWRTKGFMEVKNSRTGQVMRMGMGALNDLEKFGKSALHILNKVRKLEKPLLVVHGREDETVPYHEAEHINIYGDPSQTFLRLIPNTGHTFGSTHPFDEPTEEFEQVLSVTASFFKENLKSS